MSSMAEALAELRRKREQDGGSNGSVSIPRTNASVLPDTSGTSDTVVHPNSVTVSGDGQKIIQSNGAPTSASVPDFDDQDVANATSIGSLEAPTPLPEAKEVLEKLASLKEALSKGLPGYEGILFTIHKMLLVNQQLPHMLTDEQIGVYVAGLSKKSGLVLLEEAKRSKSKAIKNMEEEDLV